MLPKLPVPCQEMSQLAFKFSDGFEQIGYDSFPLLIQFPDKIRAITQSQAIDTTQRRPYNFFTLMNCIHRNFTRIYIKQILKFFFKQFNYATLKYKS